jgi:hypothetical protein
MLPVLNVSRDAVRPATGHPKGATMTTLRRLAHSASPARLRGWHLELLAAATLLGGVLGMISGTY